MVLSTRQMSVSCAEVEFISYPPKARSPCLKGAWHARSLQKTNAAAVSSASRVRRWLRARTLEARLSRSRLALNLHSPAAKTVPATHVGGAPPCAARTCLLRSRRRRSARSCYCTLFNNRCVLSAYSCVSQNTHRRRASAVRFSAFRLPNPTQTRRREVHGGLWPRLESCFLFAKLEPFWPNHYQPRIASLIFTRMHAYTSIDFVFNNYLSFLPMLSSNHTMAWRPPNRTCSHLVDWGRPGITREWQMIAVLQLYWSKGYMIYTNKTEWLG